MNREEMEQAAMDGASKYYDPVGWEPAYDGGYFDGFRAGAEWLADRPLPERLTAEELAMLRECPMAEEAGWLREMFGNEITDEVNKP